MERKNNNVIWTLSDDPQQLLKMLSQRFDLIIETRN